MLRHGLLSKGACILNFVGHEQTEDLVDGILRLNGFSCEAGLHVFSILYEPLVDKPAFE
jgi:hypothetical protein